MNVLLWMICAALVVLATVQLVAERDLASALVLLGLAALIGPVGVWLMRDA